ncbi:MAG: LysR family transcriptional regulator [Clostridia bacterium]|nr:LysR family transcriptional regulator [Clostridia bacterium]
MDIQKLKYFYTTAQLEHITRASEILHISQPSLTQAIQSLEFELGVLLFERKGRRIILTQFGQFLKERLDCLLPQFDNIPNEIEQLKKSVNKTIKLNILAASSFVINTIMSYKKRNPDVIFEFEQNEQKYDCDILITTNGLNSDNSKNYVKRCIREEKIYLAVPKNSIYASYTSIDLTTVKDESFIMLSNTRLFGVICNKYCSIAGFLPKILFESDSPVAVQNIISMGAGIAFWPEYSWGKINNKNVTLIPISYPVCQRDLIIELHNRLPKSAYAEDFYKYLLSKI